MSRFHVVIVLPLSSQSLGRIGSVNLSRRGLSTPCVFRFDSDDGCLSISPKVLHDEGATKSVQNGFPITPGKRAALLNVPVMFGRGGEREKNGHNAHIQTAAPRAVDVAVEYRRVNIEGQKSAAK